ncbi:hypothetical protein Dsin_005186 [Dipteronia sinensis]|uniref:Uncharacterized protein n=1 Tax=Dipteronia sinensis TaxID=43782 RepID=A0AAE0EEP0_9ROSI|nr:hypothetical protein Dsin_005186 [Dipteronia sinensis]
MTSTMGMHVAVSKVAYMAISGWMHDAPDALKNFSYYGYGWHNQYVWATLSHALWIILEYASSVVCFAFVLFWVFMVFKRILHAFVLFLAGANREMQ